MPGPVGPVGWVGVPVSTGVGGVVRRVQPAAAIMATAATTMAVVLKGDLIIGLCPLSEAVGYNGAA